MWYKYRKYKYKKGGKMDTTSFCGIFAVVFSLFFGIAVNRYIKHLRKIHEENERDRETWSPPSPPE